jgi:hypothetical protein
MQPAEPRSVIHSPDLAASPCIAVPGQGGATGPRVARPRFEFLAEDWREILQSNGLGDFQTLWERGGDWVEPINHRRGGWSGVTRVEVKLADGTRKGLFVKRQQGHFCRLPSNPLRSVPTSQREYLNLRRCRRYGIPTPDLVYFARHGRREMGRSLLVTAELDDYRPLSEWTGLWCPPGHGSILRLRRRVLRSLGQLIRRLHACHLQHHALQPANLFLRLEPDGTLDLRLLDLEMMRWHPWPVYRDLLTLYRKSPEWSRSDHMAFFLAYLGAEHLRPAGKWLWQALSRWHNRRSARVD